MSKDQGRGAVTPHDMERRRSLLAICQPPQPGGIVPGREEPVLAEVPLTLRDLAAAPAQLYSDGVRVGEEARVGTDVPQLNEAQRAQLNLPQAAVAPMVARAQVRALEQLEPTGVKVPPPGPEVLTRCCDQHEELRTISLGIKGLLSEVGVALNVVRGTRVLAQRRAAAWIAEQLKTTPPGTERQAWLQSLQEAVAGVTDKQAQKEATTRAAAAQQRAAAEAQIGEAEAEYQLAEVLMQLRQGQTPDPAALLAAAARLQKLREQQASGAATTAKTTDKTTDKPARGRAQKR